MIANNSVNVRHRQLCRTAHWFIWAPLLLAVVVTLSGCGASQDPERHPAVGRALPHLELRHLTGDSTDLTLEDVRGRVILLNFWATWCAPCQEEFPHLATLAEKLKDEPKFQLLAVAYGSEVNLDIEQLQKEVEIFLRREDSQLPTYADPNGWSQRGVLMALNEDMFAYPTTLVLDGQGIIRGVWEGYSPASPAEMESLVRRLLAAK